MFVKDRRVSALLLAVSITFLFSVTGCHQAIEEHAVKALTDAASPKDAALIDSVKKAISENKPLDKDTCEAVLEKMEIRLPNDTLVNDTQVIESMKKAISENKPLDKAMGEAFLERMDALKKREADLTTKTLVDALQGNQPIDGITALAILGIGSFFVDRISTFALKFLAMFGPWRKLFPAPESIPDDQPQLQSKARSKLVVVYYLFAGLVAIGLIAHYGHVRLFSAVGFGEIHPTLDQILTGLTMVIGSERVAQWLNLPGTPGVQKADPDPIKIFGDLSLEEASKMLEEVTQTASGQDEQAEAK